MKIVSLLPVLSLVTFAVTVNAHAHLQSSSPAENSVITASPPNLVLQFSEAARLTALSIQKGNEASHDMKPLPTITAPQVSVSLPSLTPGSYTVTFRNVSNDGHVMSGTLHFTLAPGHAEKIPADHSAQH